MILKGNEDLRVRRTIHSIKESFLSLLNEQGYDSITVTGLAARAGISKKTFYYYYSSLDSLLDEMEGELISNFLDEISDIDIKDVDKIVKKFLIFFEDKEGFLFKILHTHDGRVFGDKVFESAKDRQIKAFTQLHTEDIYMGRAVRFYLDTILIDSYRLWAAEDKKVSADKVAASMKELILHGIESLIAEPTGRTF